MKQNRKMIAGLGLLALVMSSGQVIADPHSDGLALGKSNLSKLSSKVNNANAQSMPHYTNNPPQSGNFGSSSLFEVGVGRINTCKTAVAGSDKVANQECDAVNFLAKNPENRVKFPVSPNDPIIKGIGNTINNATGGNVDQVCTTKTTTTPDIYATEVCNEYNLSEAQSCSMGQVVQVDADSNYLCNTTHNSLQTLDCHRGAKPTILQAPQAMNYSVDQGQNVPGYTSLTFNMNMPVTGTPERFTLTAYQVDNNGQLWINGTVVYQNIFPAWAGRDLRNSYLKENSRTGAFTLVDQNNINIGAFSDDNCNPGCRGLAPNLDITQYIHEGNNDITLVCINANKIGPCSVSIQGTTSTAMVVGSVIENGCTELEGKAL
ncbi:hypothetical protein [Pseudomonas fluorescens]|uniref:Conjugal transfer protein TraN n=1 Tax=Pseudomonas fluorescens TaxID=294 RepID=A0A5E7N6B8_PSEFL|nr:hypothetical protein [Pseudomonas fluorescens]VVP32267.1 hypothetical protein PS880_04403 [Pseudomonas fluorescens]